MSFSSSSSSSSSSYSSPYDTMVGLLKIADQKLNNCSNLEGIDQLTRDINEISRVLLNIGRFGGLDPYQIENVNKKIIQLKTHLEGKKELLGVPEYSSWGKAQEGIERLTRFVNSDYNSHIADIYAKILGSSFPTSQPVVASSLSTPEKIGVFNPEARENIRGARTECFLKTEGGVVKERDSIISKFNELRKNLRELKGLKGVNNIKYDNGAFVESKRPTWLGSPARDLHILSNKLKEFSAVLKDDLQNENRWVVARLAIDINKNFYEAKAVVDELPPNPAKENFITSMNQELNGLLKSAIHAPAVDKIPSLAVLHQMAKENNDHIGMASILSQLGDTLGYMDASSPKSSVMEKGLVIESDCSSSSVRRKAIGSETSLSADSPLFKQEGTYLFSDDTVFSDMVRYVLENSSVKENGVDAVVDMLTAYYVQYGPSGPDKFSSGRGHGRTMGESLNALNNIPLDWSNNKFDFKKTGCGCTMRNGIMGAILSKPEEFNQLVQLALRSSYVTHTSPIGFLGGLNIALYSALLRQEVPLSQIPGIIIELTKFGGPVYQAAEKMVKFGSDKSSQKERYNEQWRYCDQVARLYLGIRFPQDKFSLQKCPDTTEGTDWLLTQISVDTSGKRPLPTISNTGDVENERIVGKDSTGTDIGKTYNRSELWGAADGISAFWGSVDMYMRTMNSALEPGEIETITREGLESKLAQADDETRNKLFYEGIERSALHGGDSDSTGAVAMFLQGLTVGKHALPLEAEPFLSKAEKKIFWAPPQNTLNYATTPMETVKTNKQAYFPGREFTKAEFLALQSQGVIENEEEKSANLFKEGDFLLYEYERGLYVLGIVTKEEGVVKSPDSSIIVDFGDKQQDTFWKMDGNRPVMQIFKNTDVARGARIYDDLYRLKKQ